MRTKPSSSCLRHRPAVGAEREEAGQDLAMRRPRRFGRQAHRDDLRVGEADRRDRAMVEGALFPGDDLGDHFALRHRAMGEHRLAGHIADRPDVAHRGRASVVDADERPRHGQVEPFEPEAFGARPAPDRDQDLVRGDRRLLAVRVLDPERAPVGPKRPRAAASGRSRDRRRGARPAGSAPRRRAAGFSAAPRPPSRCAPSLAKAMPSSMPI